MASTATSRFAESAYQGAFRVRLDWARAALTMQLGRVDALVIVDVLSFCTCVDVAVARGVGVYPWAGSREAARQFAERRQARLAGSRRAPGDDGLSLSPASLVRCEGNGAVVLPSPNGSALAREAARSDAPVFAACLRNATAVGRYLRQRGGVVAVIAAGERWPDGSLRPALEDQLGAGAVIAALDGDEASPEAQAACASFRGLADRLPTVLADSASGRELVAAGFADDVALAAELDVSATVPALIERMFVDARGVNV